MTFLASKNEGHRTWCKEHTGKQNATHMSVLISVHLQIG